MFDTLNYDFDADLDGEFSIDTELAALFADETEAGQGRGRKRA